MYKCCYVHLNNLYKYDLSCSFIDYTISIIDRPINAGFYQIKACIDI